MSFCGSDAWISKWTTRLAMAASFLATDWGHQYGARRRAALPPGRCPRPYND